MADWKNPDVVLKVPRALAEKLNKIAKLDDSRKTWAVKSREILNHYVLFYEARGAE